MDKFFKERIAQLREAKQTAVKGGGEKKLAAIREKGRMSARERIEYLMDEGSFFEYNMLLGYLEKTPGDGLICGHGTVNGKLVTVYSQDSTVKGGSIGGMHGYKMYKTVEKALEMGVPFIGLHDSPGARLPKIEDSKSVFGDGLEKSGSIFFPNTKASGIIPQISAIMGSCAGISVYSPALNDFIYMVDKQGQMYITGPAMVKAVMGSDITHEELGGAKVHCKISGVADGRFENEQKCLDEIKALLSYLPLNMNEKAPEVEMGDDPNRTLDDLLNIIPANPAKPYDVRNVISLLVDKSVFLEIKPEFAGEVVVGFGRLNNQSVGIIANQPKVKAGSMTADSSDKQARFIRFCDCFNIPLVFLVDTPAYLPGKKQEHAGIIRHGAKVLYALCEATVPRVVVVMKKSYGGGNLGMGVVPGMGTDFVFFWPTVEVGVLGTEASVYLHFGKEIFAAENPDEFKKEKLKEFHDKYANPMREVSANWAIDDVIEPADTRKVLIKALEFLAGKTRNEKYPKRHGNIPL